jgi:glycosyltransferase involved in cell wall biosynthesis
LDLPNFVSLPFNLATEIADLCSIDIGLMPLPDTEWTRGKCAFKAIQYMAVGAVPIASPVGITQDLVRHGINGFLATSTEEWFRALQLLIDNPSIRQQLSVSARRTVEREYSLQVWGSKFVRVIRDNGAGNKQDQISTCGGSQRA